MYAAVVVWSIAKKKIFNYIILTVIVVKMELTRDDSLVRSCMKDDLFCLFRCGLTCSP